MLLRSRSTGELLADESGSAALEFIFVGVLLLVPLVYLIVALGQIQGQSLGIETGARHIARAVATATDADDARDRAELIARSVTAEYGMDAASTHVSFSCSPAGTRCPSAGAILSVRLTTRVRLPLAPPVLGLDRLATIPISAFSVQKVSTAWMGP